ncbi:DMT family transporter [Magnetovibrio sp.]|uniref:DMT family transporter n=1 Tax=Magnetovibrio sp. TaxID=2024836 RepID=UPI002F93372B
MLGIAYLCAGVLLFVIGDALSKSLVANYSVPQIAFVKSLATLIVLLPWIARANTRARLKTKRPWMHAMRATFGLAEMACFLLALRTIPLADVTAVYYAAPLIATALSVVLLGERVSVQRWGAVVIGFIGMLIIVQPGNGLGLELGTIYITAGMALYAGLMIVNRIMGATESTTSMVLYAVISETVVMGLLSPFYWTPMSAFDALHMAALGLVITLGIFAFTRAYKCAPVATVAPFDYTALIWAVLFGYLFWNELPALSVWLGAGLILVCGLYVLYREHIEGVIENDKGRPYDHHE